MPLATGNAVFMHRTNPTQPTHQTHQIHQTS